MKLEGLQNITTTINGGKLQKFLCSLQWIKQKINYFSEKSGPLYDLVERVYERAGKQTKRATSKLILRIVGWNNLHHSTLNRFKDSIANQVCLAHRDTKKLLSFYTDASDYRWASLKTQVPMSDLIKHHIDQRHESLALLSRILAKVQLNWPTIKKIGV